MIKLRELIKESDCGCGGTTSCGCESIHESAKEIIKGKKLSQLLQKDESRLRLNMWELVGLMSIDDSNKKLADALSRSYKKNVTIFMRDMLSLVKKMK